MSHDAVFDPENRELYTTLVRAPDGYSFGHAAAATYSLDFETALAIPIAIVFRDAENKEEMLASPLALLQSVERLAGRMAIYCDRGRIKDARPNTARLLSLYEKTIIEVGAPGGGAFHPKLWCIRFEPENTVDPVRMRLAILSRNLTNDRCWDLALCLDGTVEDEANEDNAPISKLLRALPRLANEATRPTPPKFLISLARDLDHCRWDKLPAGATKVRFAVNGLDGERWMPPKGDRIAILSPFVSSEALEDLAAGYDGPGQRRLIARAEELDCIKPEVRELYEISTLDERATHFEEEEEEITCSADLEGLHAKAYLVERGSRLHIHLGSANATSAALRPEKRGRTRNVEVMATLDGPISRMGKIEDVLFSEGFNRLLNDYAPSESPQQDAAAAAEKSLEELRCVVSALPLDLHCTQQGDLIGLEIKLAGKAVPLDLPPGVRCFVRAVTVPNERGHDSADLLAGKDQALSLGSVALGDVTRWLGIRLLDEETKIELAFTLGARLVGLPEGRDEAVLRAHIANVENFLRYLSLLLGTLGEGSFLESETGGEGQWLRRLSQDGTSLLEPLVRALSLDGDELAEIDSLVMRLKNSGGADDIIPKGFLALWDSFAPLVKRKGARR